MNDNQLDNAIRAELAADAARTPAAGATKLAIHEAVAGLPSADHPHLARRWLLPVAAAAVLVALTVAGFLVPKALSGHPARPATPKPRPSPTQPALPPAPVVKLSCPSGQRTVDGLNTALKDINGAPRLAYEYYCAGPDGSRSFSDIRIYQQTQGKLTPVRNEIIALIGEYVMSMSGSEGGLQLRSYNAFPGAVTDLTYPVDPNGGDINATPVAAACQASDLKVSTSQANEPVGHTVLTLTNHSSKTCAVWGTPKYTIEGSVPAKIRYLLNGPAGGAEGLLSSPVLLVQAGHSVSASVGSDPISGQGCQEVERVKAVLPNGVSLGTPDLHVCDNLVGYPFVDAANGSLTHPESEAPTNVATGSCVDNVATVIELGTPTLAVNHRRHDVITIHSAGKANCALTGYADIRQLSPSGVLQAIARQTASGPAGGISGSTPPIVQVSPGHPASVLIEWSDQGQGCTPSGQISMRLGGGGYAGGDSTGLVCDLQVHPFVAGATGSETGDPVADCNAASFSENDSRLTGANASGVLFQWKNAGNAPCAFDGYPTAHLLTASGALLATARPVANGALGGLSDGTSATSTKILLPGDSLSAVVEWRTSGSGCVQASSLKVTLPDAGAELPTLDSTQCDVQVHPYVFGTTGKG